MVCATKEILNQIEEISQKRKNEILNNQNCVKIEGNTYYVSNFGNDDNDGKSPQTAWKTLEKVNQTVFSSGDGVLFRRGDIFRGFINTQSGVTYAAYGKGEKPKFYGCKKSLCDLSLWSLYDAEHNIWKLNELILDCGTLVFNDGEYHSRKLIPSYINSQFVCRDNPNTSFVISQEMTKDLDIVCFYDKKLSTDSSKGENFPIPVMDAESYGELYLRCDKGNPAQVFQKIEAVVRQPIFNVYSKNDVTIDNLCLKYASFGVAAGGVRNLNVTNCEIAWMGGNIQHYAGDDPNYPEGRRGSVTRYGNGVEVYGSCDGYNVSGCYIYQIYDAGITHQVTTRGKTFNMVGIRYQDNLLENCVYSIEYFLEKTDGDTQSHIKDCEISGNIMRFSGYGWGQQRHNINTPAHIKGWSYENTASDFWIHDNVFDRAAYRMVHLVAKKDESLPEMYNNTYIQQLGLPLGQYGTNEISEPPIIKFDMQTDEKISCTMGDKNAKIYYIK